MSSKAQTLTVVGGPTPLQRTLAGVPIRLFIFVVLVIWTMPTLGLLVSSFRTQQAIAGSGWWQGLFNFADFSQWTTANYQRVLYADQMANAFFNSLLITIPSTVIPITMAAFAAFAIAWMVFPGRQILFVVIVGLLIVPLQMALIPVLRVYTRYGINGTYLGMWLAHTGFGLPLATYMLYGYISTIPKSIIESAHADGATPWMSFTRLVLPLSIPAIASFAIFQFLWVWNDLLVALVFFGTRRPIVTTRLAELVGSRGQSWHVLTSGAFVTMIVPLIIFFSLQRYFVRGMMAGSVKG
ncbi:MAG: carbohydrate ABC transporter permease [Spirochaetaceae bacterium]|nr:MAG: carbohydrate ABC transporter permease [Spirochaetaceae bacterium]